MFRNPQSALPALAAVPAAEPEADAASRRVRRHAGIAALLFLPALVAAKVFLLSTEEGTRCLMTGRCRPFPGVFFLVLLAAVVASYVVVWAAPRRFRKGALTVQLALEALAVLTVLAYP
ncbi:hypothetical protein [Streptomyces sp. NRRL S-244]|uniref:hypothetical protein n=1 Tax=Streptomyces sp. NRRL S-244 TaxID=1463897 RepID=UPI0004C19501|nr:hypothetical protein [Streptomyces sp. NRRL S-244]